jgi:hypothetical protein
MMLLQDIKLQVIGEQSPVEVYCMTFLGAGQLYSHSTQPVLLHSAFLSQ